MAPKWLEQPADIFISWCAGANRHERLLREHVRTPIRDGVARLLMANISGLRCARIPRLLHSSIRPAIPHPCPPFVIPAKAGTQSGGDWET